MVWSAGLEPHLTRAMFDRPALVLRQFSVVTIDTDFQVLIFKSCNL